MAEGVKGGVYALPMAGWNAFGDSLSKLDLSTARPAPASLVAAHEVAEDPAMSRETIAILDIGSEVTQILVTQGKSLLGETKVPAGLSSVFSAIQEVLELKFVGSAAKLFYDGVYDFSDLAEGYEITYVREGWQPRGETVILRQSGKTQQSAVTFPEGSLVITSVPGGADVFVEKRFWARPRSGLTLFRPARPKSPCG